MKGVCRFSVGEEVVERSCRGLGSRKVVVGGVIDSGLEATSKDDGNE